MCKNGHKIITIHRRSRWYFIFGHSPHTTGVPTHWHIVPASTHWLLATRKRVAWVEKTKLIRFLILLVDFVYMLLSLLYSFLRYLHNNHISLPQLFSLSFICIIILIPLSFYLHKILSCDTSAQMRYGICNSISHALKYCCHYFAFAFNVLLMCFLA